jgi:hypothetical protein
LPPETRQGRDGYYRAPRKSELGFDLKSLGLAIAM